MVSQLSTSTHLQAQSQEKAKPTIKLRTQPVDYPLPEAMTCTKTNLVIPKKVQENLLWRKRLRQAAMNDAGMRQAILCACTESWHYWVNAFCWTYRQKEVDVNGNERLIKGEVAHAPMVTWPIQDETASEIIDGINGGLDINLEKSRDMGASWLILYVTDWYFLFHKNVNVGLVSRKEVLVDSRGDMDSLFEKIRYNHRMMPSWMLPRIYDRYMHMQNRELNSTIAGESTNQDVGRGGRKTFYVVDEAAAITNAEEIESSLSQNTPCQIWVSTPKGPMTQFHVRLKEGRGKRIQMAWWRHPEKSRGAKQVADPDTGKIRWSSPWYEKLDDRMSRKTKAQEVDMDHGQAGDIFFDYGEIERHRQDHECKPSSRGDILPVDSFTEEELTQVIQGCQHEKFVWIDGHGASSWRLWINLQDGRPPQHLTYVFGIDVGNGAGESNSVITAKAREINMVVAKWWSAFKSPEELALIAAYAGLWFGGVQLPSFICWENNGPGGIFGRKLVKMGYPHYYKQRPTGTKRDKKTPKWGWHNNRERKEVLLGMYRDALTRDQIINPCKESLDEAMDYIYDQTGALIPAVLREEASGGRELHGDHVIADALAEMASEELPVQRKRENRAVPGSFLHRKQRAARLRKQRQDAEEWL